MKALVVYDSVFGNTEKIAQAIGQALGAQAMKPENVRPEHVTGLDLLVVGSPTRKFQATPATMALLKRMPPGALQGVKTAAFDTRIAVGEDKSTLLHVMVRWFGYAAEKIARQLQKKGGSPIRPPEGFIVNATEGPLRKGEIERAATWAQALR
jgi:flavodoxin